MQLLLYPKDPVLPTGITLNQKTATGQVGATKQLTATVEPSDADDKTVTWTSSANNIASVDNAGLVTLKAVGSATITATTSNGLTATCAVTVTAVPVDSVTLSQTAVSGKPADFWTVTATVLPENATDKTVTWTSDKPAVATVANGKVTAVAVGTATITATAGGKSATMTVTVAVAP